MSNPVPTNNLTLAQLKIGFIGAGRLAQALALGLENIGLQVVLVASRSMASAQYMAQQLKHCQAASPQDLADQCDLVFITTPDAAIQTTAESINWHANQSVIHCSGATEISVLATAARSGAEIGGFHPMQTFGADAQASCASLAGSTIAIEADDNTNTLAWLKQIAAALKCNPIELPTGARAIYHASGGYVADKFFALVNEAIKLWQSWGASEQAAMAALLPLIKGSVASLEQNGVAAGMPGPISRGDYQVVGKHRQAINKIDPDMRDLYDQLSLRVIDIAHQANKIDASQQQQLEQTIKAEIKN